jgi:CHAD domain-containing protein
MKDEEAIVIDPSTSLLVETLGKRWKTYRGELKSCSKEASEESIHDMRVATRRLLALVDMLREITPHPRLQKLRRTIKNQLEGLDDLRDTQVMLVEVSEVLDDLPELEVFQEYLVKREKHLLRSVAKAIKSLKLDGIRKRLDATRQALLKKEKAIDHQKALLQVVDDIYETNLRRYQRIEPAQPATLHRLRVVFKTFRYTVEIVHPLVSNFPAENSKHMHDYQGLLGDIQDLEIFMSNFDDFANNDNTYNLDSVRHYYKQRHTEAMNAFLEDMHQINIFWRPSPEAPFPWEVAGQPEKSTPANMLAEPLPERKKDGNGEQVEAVQEAQK